MLVGRVMGVPHPQYTVSPSPTSPHYSPTPAPFSPSRYATHPPGPDCRTEYEEECKTEYEQSCRTEYQDLCLTVNDVQCSTVREERCLEVSCSLVTIRLRIISGQPGGGAAVQGEAGGGLRGGRAGRVQGGAGCLPHQSLNVDASKSVFRNCWTKQGFFMVLLNF